MHLNKFRETHKETVIYIHTYQIALPSLAGAVEGGGASASGGGGESVWARKTLLFMAGALEGGRASASSGGGEGGVGGED